MQSFGLFEIIVALAIGIGAGALYYFLIPYIWRRHYVNQVKTHFADIIGNSVELQITDDFIETKDKTGETKVKLTAIKKVYETEKLFVIQSCNGETLTVAKQDIDFVRFRERLIAHGLNIDYQIMKKIIVSAFLCFFLIPSVFSQNGEYVGGASFIKRIEYNLIMLDGVYNLRCGVEEREPFFPRITSGVIHLRHLPVSA
jgi:hypothetical protein